jgi:bacteriorhodopsin
MTSSWPTEPALGASSLDASTGEWLIVAIYVWSDRGMLLAWRAVALVFLGLESWGYYGFSRIFSWCLLWDCRNPKNAPNKKESVRQSRLKIPIARYTMQHGGTWRLLWLVCTGTMNT